MRGIKFIIPNEYGNYLHQILEGIELNKFFWTVEEDEIFISNSGTLMDRQTFLADSATGEEFQKFVEMPSYYLFFANIKAFTSEQDVYEIDTYGDFLKGKCEFVILIVDSVFVEIYAKDKDRINIIKSNAMNNNFKDIQFITDENDRRKIFSLGD